MGSLAWGDGPVASEFTMAKLGHICEGVPTCVKPEAGVRVLSLLVAVLCLFTLNCGFGASIRNDYDGDGKSDFAVYDLMEGSWFILSGNNSVITWNQKWGFASCLPLPGDYNGDGYSDIAVYFEAEYLCYARTINNTVLMWNLQASIGTAQAGDYLGRGKDEVCIYNAECDGWWNLAYEKKGEYNLGSAVQAHWGYSGTVPVLGDYNGDGRDDLAVFDESRGNWYVYDISNNVVLAWQVNWGYRGCVPVPGDYDGDGRSDLAVYAPLSGKWYIWSLTKGVLSWGARWGFAEGVPVPGDYNGDGSDDMAIYDTAKGDWYIKTLSNSVITWKKKWGYAGAWPVGAPAIASSTVMGDWLTDNRYSLHLTQTGSVVRGIVKHIGDGKDYGGIQGFIYGKICIIVYIIECSDGAISKGAMVLKVDRNSLKGKMYNGTSLYNVTCSR